MRVAPSVLFRRVNPERLQMTSNDDHSSSQLDLREDIREIEEHQLEGFHRIHDYYSTEDEQNPEAITGLEEPPHSYILDDAIEAIVRSINIRESNEGFVEDRYAWDHVYYTQLAIATEGLLTAIVLKWDSDYYFRKSESDDTANFSILRNKILGLVSDELNGQQKKRVVDILDLLKAHRDNRVHLNFHNHTHTYHPPRIYETLAFLISYFFDAHKEEMNALIEIVQEKDNNHHGLEYPAVDFPMEKLKE